MMRMIIMMMITIDSVHSRLSLPSHSPLTPLSLPYRNTMSSSAVHLLLTLTAADSMIHVTCCMLCTLQHSTQVAYTPCMYVFVSHTFMSCRLRHKHQYESQLLDPRRLSEAAAASTAFRCPSTREHFGQPRSQIAACCVHHRCSALQIVQLRRLLVSASTTANFYVA